MPGADLSQVSTSMLERLRQELAEGRLKTPLHRASLVGLGVKHQLDALLNALSGHKTAACLAILDVILAERAQRKPSPELVWTGPEASAATARDTAVVLKQLFEQAQTRVVLAGYSFDHARDVLQPLHTAMATRGVETYFFVNIPQAGKLHSPPELHARQALADFRTRSWPFGPPYPRVFYDKRALLPGPPWSSLHAKCVAVDGLRAFVSSANFTERGQERNIEVGVLVEERAFAQFLMTQWLSLIEAGLVGEE